MEDNVIAVPLERAAAVTGVSPRRLINWSAIELVRPSVERRLSERSIIRLYSFENLLNLKIVSLLLERRVSARNIRKMLAHLEEHDRKLSECQYGIEPGTDRLFFHDGDGWADSRRPKQLVDTGVIPLAALRLELRQAIGQRDGEPGEVERRRGALGSKEVFAGTRIPVATIVRYIQKGHSDERIMDSFPDLSSRDIEVARSLAS